MDVAVVYESLFGNTRRVAEAVAEGIRGAAPAARVRVVPVADASTDAVRHADLLVVGGPTHILRTTTARTRQQGVASVARSRSTTAPVTLEPGAQGPGVREWLDALGEAEPRQRAAAFDTRLPAPLAGGAARAIGRQLRRHGFRVVDQPSGFVVKGGQGPLRDGELDRARDWGAALAAR